MCVQFKFSSFRGRTVCQTRDVLNSWKGNVVFATELARRYGKDGIVSTSLNPGML
jgi:retinol dehydrogenase 12